MNSKLQQVTIVTHNVLIMDDDITEYSNANTQAILLMNIATVYCIRQDMEKARRALQQACANVQRNNGSLHAKTVLLSAYIELHSGVLI